jgi:hypothetical protein
MNYSVMLRAELQRLAEKGDKTARRTLARRETIRRRELRLAERVRSKTGRGRNAYRLHLRRAKAIELGLPPSDWHLVRLDD